MRTDTTSSSVCNALGERSAASFTGPSVLETSSPQKIVGGRLSVARYLFILCLVVGVGLRWHALTPSTLLHPDEVFQTLEPAHHLAFGYGVVTWEWRQGVRSWVLPTFLAGVMRATEWVGAGSGGYREGVAIVLLLVSLVTIWFSFEWAACSHGLVAAVVAAALTAASPDLIALSHRALSEVVAAHALLLGLYLGAYAERISERTRFFLAAMLLGLAVSLRIQLAPAVLFICFYFCWGQTRQRAFLVAGGVLLPVLAFGFCDAITWSYPFQSFLRYFWVNIVQGRSARYGVQPWYWYLLVLAKQWPIVLFALFGLRKNPFLGWVCAFILISHSVISHKEARFIYPLIPLMITLAAMGVVECKLLFQKFYSGGPLSRSFAVTIVGGLFYLSHVYPPRDIYSPEEADTMEALAHLSLDPTLCGIGLKNISWLETGGYTYLHRKVPLVPILGKEALLEPTAFNALLAVEPIDGNSKFALREEIGGTLIYTRPGPCQPTPGADLNSYLQVTDQ
jgi:GPI mannosyltransferase 3